ncbi:hypothetical protein LTR78_001724 [Recurvomyces mirabilis]|uniref:Uncharacterized protein n=1 Tax=Recurvomyces mirabilis TaxID=574656 RepID=A0AAE0WUZ4_9PEZI|nr:hypothetical protein LTR78_001724 [Recurvomyces mirabilis]KAK5150201.1 hypothetical protein LTS14_010330 [Recurvomyces mirabilis]
MSDNDWSLYPDGASKGAPIFFAILLTALGSYQIYQSFFRYKWRYFGGTITWATTVWISGFICRIISIYHDQDIGLYIAGYVLILMGPPLYAASEYFILGRLMAYLPYHAPMHPGRVLSTFFLLSTVVEVLTANGASRSAGKNRTISQRQVGLALLKAALIVQCFIEALFFSLVVTMERRCRRAKAFPRKVRVICYVLYLTSFMMLVRCIVRTIGGFEDSKCDPEDPLCGYITLHEWVMYVFEIANITLFVIVLAVFHPGRFLPQTDKIYLDPVNNETDRLGPGFSKADKRPIWATVLDPFNLTGILSGKGMAVQKFWEEENAVHNGQELQPSKAGASTGETAVAG